MRKLLWIGDAACSTGFARATHGVLDVLRQTWDVSVLGINYRGDPHSYPYPIYPCAPGGDGFGLKRLYEIGSKVNPDVIILLNDVWNVPAYMKLISDTPVVAWLAVDGRNCRGSQLNGVALSVFWTQFALEEARLGGYSGEAEVVPLGVDLDLYYPMDRVAARQAIGLPARLRDAFIVGNVNRNQPRKRLDLTIAYFAEWVKTQKVDDAYLYLQVAPTGDQGYDCEQLARYFGVKNRLILAEPPVWSDIGDATLRAIYGSMDVQVSTTQGEGWGLCVMEGMACGIPQIVPHWAALGEWCGEAALQVECLEICVTPGGLNAVGAIPDRQKFITALDSLYQSSVGRQQFAEKGLRLVRQPQYRWPAIGHAFAEALELAVGQPQLQEVAHA